MDLHVSSVQSILKTPIILKVPIYQRKYRWTNTRIVPFWEDILSMVSSTKNGKMSSGHYMGTLLFAPTKSISPIDITTRVRIIDGQQRLTTFSLLLATIREVGP